MEKLHVRFHKLQKVKGLGTKQTEDNFQEIEKNHLRGQPFHGSSEPSATRKPLLLWDSPPLLEGLSWPGCSRKRQAARGELSK
ncbi:hypothetical protein P7K49_002666, partial [Saguinus oedipus]